MGTMARIGKTATTVRTEFGVGKLSVVYHSTEVVKVAMDGTVTLNTGGWRTATTKARMNQAANEFGLSFSVYQEKGDWFVALHTPEKRFAQRLAFDDYTISFKPIDAA